MHQVAKQEVWEIRLGETMPASKNKSTDRNVLDLSFFRALQAKQWSFGPETTIDGLIAKMFWAFDEFDPRKIDSGFFDIVANMMLKWYSGSQWWQQWQDSTPRKTGHSTSIWRVTSNFCSTSWGFTCKGNVYWGWWQNWPQHWGRWFRCWCRRWHHGTHDFASRGNVMAIILQKSCHHVLWCSINSSIRNMSSTIICNGFYFSVLQCCCRFLSFAAIVVVVEAAWIHIDSQILFCLLCTVPKHSSTRSTAM